MEKRGLLRAAFVIAISCMVSVAYADDGLKVEAEVTEDERGIALNMVVFEEIEERNIVGNKITRQVDTSSVLPGDRLVYVTTVSNHSQQLAENVAIVNPVPEHTTYLEGSAKGDGAAVTFSVDGTKHFDVAGNLTVTGVNGDSRPATTKDYTHIRWLLSSLPSKAEVEVLFRVQLD